MSSPFWALALCAIYNPIAEIVIDMIPMGIAKIPTQGMNAIPRLIMANTKDKTSKTITV